ncbi:MAG TPA: DNA mismatch repair endonuclease MutL [Minicystis sp.]|nr:DNA mismatch repair endonuclease MutL [Minicystis sp.]
MSRVRVLPDDLANQIAAGEVVERPSSVVKELVENALDAGARRVRVDVEQGGLSLVRVNDDGRGMEPEDARLAVLRHATSKIASADDLRRILSFGFRGEALPSIASVSRFVLRTRTRERDEGTEVRVEGGGRAEVLPCGGAAGTTVEVRDLFFNVPARRKFLRALATESAHVTEVAQAAALGEPGVTVVLARDGRVVKEWLRAASREERARLVHADEELAPCRGERGPLGVEAFVSRPERARSGAAWLSIFVNGRPVRDRSLARAVALAYGSVLEGGRYPVGVVYLDLPHELVDVNVHPQKAEVRFADGRAVADALYKVVADDVARAFGLPHAGHTRGRAQQALIAPPPEPARDAWIWSAPPGSAPPGIEPAFGPATDDPSPVDATDAPAFGAEPHPGPVPYPTAGELLAASAARSQPAFSSLRFVAQVRNTFLVCEGQDGLYVLDQHAAAERVTFDRLKRGYDAREVASQKLLFPVVVTVAPLEVALVEQAEEAIARLGMEVAPAGPNEVAVRAVPLLLAKTPPERLVRDLLDEIGHGGERAFSGSVDLAIATMACHGSIRAGDAVPPDEARALLAALDEVDFAGHCPHGRPVVMRIGWAELETRVGRR